MAYDAGIVQGAGWFHTSAASGTTVNLSSIQPQYVEPMVGDAVQFSNGDVRQVTGVSGSTVALGEVLWSNKGDPGIGDATLSNIDGDSTENGFTQAAVKGVAQAKNYYNLGAFDTFVSNGDGTGTVTRKTGLASGAELDLRYSAQYQVVFATVPNSSVVPTNSNNVIGNLDFYDVQPERIIVLAATGINNQAQAEERYGTLLIQYELATEYQYSEPVIENQPIRPANQEEEYYWHEEWRKGLNLCPIKELDLNVQGTAILGKFEAGTYTIDLNTPEQTGQFQIKEVETNDTVITSYLAQITTFTLTKNTNIYISYNPITSPTSIMLVRGSHPYPYEDYHGGIVREKDLSGVQLFPEGVNPAQTIGGDWEDKGTVTTSDNTVFHAYRRL